MRHHWTKFSDRHQYHKVNYSGIKSIDKRGGGQRKTTW